MRLFLKTHIWDYLLCVAASVALCFTACSVFYATQPFQNAAGVALMVGIAVLLNAAMFAASTSTRAAVAGAVGLLALAIVVLAACFATSSGASVLDDVAGNNVFFALACMLSCALVFLLSRKRMTCLLLLVLGVVFCALVEYLYWYGHVVAFVLWLHASLGLFVFRTYQKNLLGSETQKLAFGSVTASGLALGAVALLVAAGLFAAVIAPLNPPNQVIKLFTAHYRVDEVQVVGIGDVQNVQNNNLFSHNATGDAIATDNVNADASSKKGDEDAQAGTTTEQSTSSAAQNTASMGNEGGEQQAQGMTLPSWLIPALIAGLIVLIAAAIALKKYLRRRRFARMTQGGPATSMKELYLFFLTRFKKLGMPVPHNQTLPEYLVSAGPELCVFEGAQAQGSSAFAALTAEYQKAVYAPGAAQGDAADAFEEYYRGFYKRACRYKGRLRYCLLFFRI